MRHVAIFSSPSKFNTKGQQAFCQVSLRLFNKGMWRTTDNAVAMLPPFDLELNGMHLLVQTLTPALRIAFAHEV